MDRKLFIGGAWVAAKAGQVLEIRDPANGEPVGTSALAMAADADRAVAAAPRGQPCRTGRRCMPMRGRKSCTAPPI